jgi:hypothetical protein
VGTIASILRHQAKRIATLTAERDKAREEAARWGAAALEADHEQVAAELDRDAAIIERDEAVKRAEAAAWAAVALRAVLERYEIIHYVDEEHWYCRQCYGVEMHADWCPVGAALTPDAGADLLARVKRLEAFATAVGSALVQDRGDYWQLEARLEDAQEALRKPRETKE